MHQSTCYVFEYVPTPLASGGVGLFVDQSLHDAVLEKTSNEAFQAIWIEISFVNHKNIVYGIIYRQHNSPEYFQSYFEKVIEKMVSYDKTVYIMGDFNIDLLKCETSQISQDFPLFLEANVLPITFLYHEYVASLMFDINSNNAPINMLHLFKQTSSIHSYNTRSSTTSRNLYVQNSRLEMQRRFFSRLAVRLWNEIPCHMRVLPKKTFKRALRTSLLNICKTKMTIFRSL